LIDLVVLGFSFRIRYSIISLLRRPRNRYVSWLTTMIGKSSGPALIPDAGHRSRKSKTSEMSSYRSFDQDGNDLRETHEERKEFDRELNESLLETWNQAKKASTPAGDEEVPPGQGRTVMVTGNDSPELVDSSESVQVIERPPARPQLNSEPLLPTLSKGHPLTLSRASPQVPIRSKTLPVLDPLPSDDPFSTTSFMAPKPSAAMAKLLEAHQAFEKRELKNKMRGSRSKVLDGCVIAVVMSQKAFSSLRDKWNLVSRLGHSSVMPTR